jgi:hypothetical protein
MYSGIRWKIQHSIVAKLEAAGANSREKAVTAEEAGFDLQEQNWLRYFAGGLGSKVKKTKNNRYYTITYKKNKKNNI